jgi:hypothetical protein
MTKKKGFIFMTPGEDDDSNHNETQEEAGDGGRYDGGCGQEEAVVDTEGALGYEVHDHGEERGHEANDNALEVNSTLICQNDKSKLKFIVLTNERIRYECNIQWKIAL